MSLKNNRIGQSHGVFKVLSLAGIKNKQTLWECLCTSCGSRVIRQNRYFRKDRPVPKGCSNCKGENNWNYKGYRDMSGAYLSRVKKQSKERGFEFKVSFEELWELFLKQNSKCYLTGLPLKFGKNQTASLDRLDSSLDYTLENLAWCHKDVNRMKNKFDLDYFIKICNLVREPNVKEAK